MMGKSIQNRIMLLTILKYQLLNLTDDQLKQFYTNEQSINNLERCVDWMLDEQEGFVHLDSHILDKISNVYSNVRKYCGENNEAVPIFLFHLEYYKKRNMAVMEAAIHDLAYEEMKLRKCNWKGGIDNNISTLKQLYTIDYVTYYSLRHGQLQSLANNPYLLSSTNYFLSVCPDLYLENPLYIDDSRNIINSSMQQGDKQYCKQAKMTLRRLDKIQK